MSSLASDQIRLSPPVPALFAASNSWSSIVSHYNNGVMYKQTNKKITSSIIQDYKKDVFIINPGICAATVPDSEENIKT